MRRVGEKGFTLVEVLVALMIFALAVVALLNAQTASLRTIAAVDDRAYAEIIAENQMVLAVTLREDLRMGFTTGEATLNGRTYAWRRGVFDGGLPGLRRIEMNVTLKGEEHVLYSLTALKSEDG